MQEILFTTVIVVGIAAILAAVLTLADRTVGNYGEVQMTINNDKQYTVEGGSTLLSTLISEKVFIPSACGGKGSCGYCKVKVMEGAGPVIATEKPWLTEAELNDHVRISCQVKVKNDIKIEIPEELFNVKEYETEVERVEQLTKTIKQLRFDLKGETISFKPGQYVQLKAPAYEGNDEEVYRAYSVASSVNDTGAIELLIGYTGGIATTYVHQHLKEKDLAHINGPYGDFFYQEDDGGPIILAAAGTGMAPILSILQYMEDHDIQRKAIFFFGARTMEDLFLTEKLKGYEKSLHDFTYVPTLTREESPEWTGDKGRVPVAIDKYIEDGAPYTAYLCGSPDMIDSIFEKLLEKGLKEENIYFDKF